MLLVVFFCVDLFVLLQVLRSLEGFLADLIWRISKERGKWMDDE